MKPTLKAFIVIITICFFKANLHAQILHPVKWSYASKIISGTSAILYFKADIEDGWHIYSVNQRSGGPLKTSFTYVKPKDYTLIGTPLEPTPLTHFDQTFGINVLYFTNTVTFRQKVKIINKNIMVKGKLRYMACNDHQCLSPEELDFNIRLK